MLICPQPDKPLSITFKNLCIDDGISVRWLSLGLRMIKWAFATLVKWKFGAVAAWWGRFLFFGSFAHYLKGPVWNICKDWLAWNRMKIYVFSLMKSLKKIVLFSVTNNEHLHLHKEQVNLSGRRPYCASRQEPRIWICLKFVMSQLIWGHQKSTD